MDLTKLYSDNEKLVWKWARRYARMFQDRADLDEWDLFQSGFLGMCDAAETYKPECGAWSTWASYYIRNAIRETLGIRTTKGTYVTFENGEPVRKRIFVRSLNAPAYASEDCDVSLADVIPDDSLPDIDENILADEDAQAVREAVAAIKKPDVRSAVTEHYLNGKALAAIAEEQGVSFQRIRQRCSEAIRTLSRDVRIMRIYKERRLDQETRFIARKGVGAFHSTCSSTVEDAVIWREQQRSRRRQGDESIGELLASVQRSDRSA